MTASSRYRPSFLLPLSYILAGLISLFIATVWLAVAPEMVTSFHYRIETIALTHVLVLGFALTIAAGALYQLAPVIFETRLHSEKVAWWHLVLHLVGTAGMIFSFLRWNMKDLGHWACAVLAGVVLLVYNIIKTARSSPKRDATSFAIGSSLVWLSLTVIAGIVLSVNRHVIFIPLSSLSLMHAHAHLGILGVFILLLMGVSYQLLPMFALTESADPRSSRRSIAAINTGLPVLFFAIALNAGLGKVLGALLVALGLLLYGRELKAMLSGRFRRQLDWGLTQFLTGQWILVPVVLCGLWLAATPAMMDTSRWETIYALLTILGVIGLSILGILQKIVPFLVWYETYGPIVGQQKVPTISEMISCRIQGLSYWTYLSGLLGMCGAALVESPAAATTGALFLTLSLVFLATNLLGVLLHWVRKKCGSASYAIPRHSIV